MRRGLPQTGMSQRLPRQKCHFRPGEKEALSAFLGVPVFSMEIDQVKRFRVFCFKAKDSGNPQKVRGVYSLSQSATRESCYVWSADENAYLRVISLFTYQERNLSFVNVLPGKKTKIDEFSN